MYYSPKQTFTGVHPKHPEYPLYPGDILYGPFGNMTKYNGLCITGFELYAEHVLEISDSDRDAWAWLGYMDENQAISRELDADEIVELHKTWLRERRQ